MAAASPPAHHPQAMIRSAHQHLQNQQILIDKAPNISGTGLAGLTEVEIVAKDNMALQLMESECGEQELTGGKVLVAHKLANGGVTMEFSTAEGAAKVRSLKEMFAAKLGGTPVLRDREFCVIAEFIPVSHDPELTVEQRVIKVDSGLP
jgi:hypothetical protein